MADFEKEFEATQAPAPAKPLANVPQVAHPRIAVPVVAKRAKPDLETIPRATLSDLLEKPCDTDYVFKTTMYGGDLYIGAMRQVLTRLRRYAKAQKPPLMLAEFHLYKIDVVTKDGYDEVTVMRSELRKQPLKGYYGKLLDILSDKPE